MTRFAALLAVLGMGLVSLRDHVAKADEAARPFVVVGYLPFYHVNALDAEAARHLTDLIYFSIVPKAAGDLDLRSTQPEQIRQLQTLKDRYHFRLLIAVGGGGLARSFPACALNPQARARFIRELARYCRANKFDGVDYDWEFPRGTAEEDAYADLIVETKQALQPEQGLVTAAVVAGQPLRPAALRALDRLHLMSYDHPGRHSTLERAKADVQKLIGQGAAKERIALGVPFYGRDIKDRHYAITYAEIVRRFHPAPEADEAGGFYFNGIKTIEEKTRYAKAEGLAGVMIWEVGQDTHDRTSLLRAIGRAGAVKPPVDQPAR
jgi:GH18 family chitinase